MIWIKSFLIKIWFEVRIKTEIITPNFYKKRFYPDQELFKKFEAGVLDGIDMIENSLEKVSETLFKQERYIEPKEEVVISEENKEEKLEEKIKEKEEKVDDDFPF